MLVVLIGGGLYELDKFVRTSWDPKEIQRDLRLVLALIGFFIGFGVGQTTLMAFDGLLVPALIIDIYFAVPVCFLTATLVIGRRRLRWFRQRQHS